MKILLVSATSLEIAPFLYRVGRELAQGGGNMLPGDVVSIPTNSNKNTISVLITGVGQALAAFHLGRFLKSGEWDLVLQVGIAGSFSPVLKKCQVVRVTSEVFADLGAEDNGSYIDLFQMGLMQPGQFPFLEGRLKVPYPSLGGGFDELQISQLQSVAAVTVNRVLSEPDTILWITKQYSPEIVSMEGASFFYAALQIGLPAIQIRSISDFVGPRDKSTWDIHGAIASLNEVVFSFLCPLL